MGDVVTAGTASWWKSHKPSKRRIIQLYSALLYNAHVRGFAEGKIFTGKSKVLCTPGLNCYSCPGAVFSCPLGSIQNALGSLDKNIGFYIFGVILLYGMLLGRTVCGWLCPAGLLQELIYRIPAPKIKKNRITRALSRLKYVILAVFAVILPVWYGMVRGVPVPAFCKYICPVGTIEAAFGLLPTNPTWRSMLGSVFTCKAVILAAVILICIFCYRAFCRFLCPLGAIYGMFNRLSVAGVRVDEERCNSCGACIKGCKMDVRRVGDSECIQCGQCAASCRQNAIGFSMGKMRVIRKVSAAAAVLLLIFMLVWANFIEAPKAGYEGNALHGSDEGEVLSDFTAVCIDGSTFDLEDTKGKVVFINLWATYCGPCVTELPLFVALYHEHEDDVKMLAVHANLTTEDVAEYIAAKGWDIPVAVDDENETIFGIVNGSQALPQTIVLNREGEVIYNEVGSVSEETLETLYEKAR